MLLYFTVPILITCNYFEFMFVLQLKEWHLTAELTKRLGQKSSPQYVFM